MEKNKLYNLTLSSILLALLIISSKVVIPISYIPITLQTIVVFLIPLILKLRYSILCYTTYIIIGLLGLPVFSSGGGFSYIYQPSFGFIIGFLLSSFIISFNNKTQKWYVKYILSFLGLIIIYLSGTIYMYLIFNHHMNLDKSYLYCINIGVLPFILKDVLSFIIACLIYSRIKEYTPNKEKTLIKLN